MGDQQRMAATWVAAGMDETGILSRLVSDRFRKLQTLRQVPQPLQPVIKPIMVLSQ